MPLKKKNNVLQFGEVVEKYSVPVLNEREIRAAAGILFLVLFIALMQILFKGDFLMVKYVIIVFLTDFVIRIFIGPRYAPTLIIGRLIVSRQTPEYVGAAQKNFAWKIGLALSVLMFFLLVILNTYSIITGISCLLCLAFLFFESAFGICLGCLLYGFFYKKEPLCCAGEICEVREREPIQKTSWTQIIIVVGCIVFLVLAIVVFNDYLRIAPIALEDRI